jgi:hypothetical protein
MSTNLDGNSMSLFRPLRRTNKDRPGFLRDEDGSATIEFVLVFPLLIWAFVGIFLFWDVFRGINTAQKSSFIVADALSRTSAPLTTGYLDGMADLLAYLAGTNDDAVRLRVSSITWDIANNRHAVGWSYSPGGEVPALTNALLLDVAPRIPTLSPFETVLLIETEVDYVPPFAGGNVGGDSRFFTLGIGQHTFGEFLVIRPRFIPRVCLTGFPCT